VTLAGGLIELTDATNVVIAATMAAPPVLAGRQSKAVTTLGLRGFTVPGMSDTGEGAARVLFTFRKPG